MSFDISIDLNQNQAKELLEFEKFLACFFLAEIKISNSTGNRQILCLFIEINSSLDFMKGLAKLFTPTNDMRNMTNYRSVNDFGQAFDKLKKTFDTEVDIKEMALYFNDTAIIVNGVSQDSIMNEVQDVLQALNDHVKYYTNFIDDIPYEIHIPAIEGLTQRLISQIPNTVSLSKSSSLYLKFWALYFDSLEKGVIYDLSKMSVIPGELHLISD